MESMTDPHWEALTPSILQAFHLPLYPLVQAPVLLEDVPLATVPEIGAMKLATIIDRGTWKDMVDLYYLKMWDRTPWSKMKKFLEHLAMEAGRKKYVICGARVKKEESEESLPHNERRDCLAYKFLKVNYSYRF